MKHHLGLYYIHQNCHENKISKKDWHVSLWRKEFRCCSWLWIWLRVCLFHYYYYFGHVFLVKKKKAYDPKFTKSNILLTAHWKQQYKTRDHLCFICQLWSLNISLETPVEKYVHFQAFTSCLILKNFHLSNVKQKKETMDNKIDCKSNSSNLL